MEENTNRSSPNQNEPKNKQSGSPPEQQNDAGGTSSEHKDSFWSELQAKRTRYLFKKNGSWWGRIIVGLILLAAVIFLVYYGASLLSNFKKNIVLPRTLVAIVIFFLFGLVTIRALSKKVGIVIMLLCLALLLAHFWVKGDWFASKPVAAVPAVSDSVTIEQPENTVVVQTPKQKSQNEQRPRHTVVERKTKTDNKAPVIIAPPVVVTTSAEDSLRKVIATLEKKLKIKDEECRRLLAKKTAAVQALRKRSAASTSRQKPSWFGTTQQTRPRATGVTIWRWNGQRFVPQ